MWRECHRLRALGVGVEPGVIPPRGWWRSRLFGDPPPQIRPPADETSVHIERATLNVVPGTVSGTPLREGRMRRLALAAAIFAAMLGGLVLHARLFGGTHYVTAIGGIQSVPLADGSRITLNTDTSIRVLLSHDERRIQLERGEAFFEVAKDEARPFIVDASTHRVVVLGTKFSVRINHDDIEVVVTEGCVSVASLEPHSVCAGAIARTSKAHLDVRSNANRDAEKLLSWRHGNLVFEGTPLADAVAEFNRYHPRKIFIEDPSIAATPVGGIVPSNDIDLFLSLLTDLGIEAEQTDGHIVLRKGDLIRSPKE
jgi:transmembrane sensor